MRVPLGLEDMARAPSLTISIVFLIAAILVQGYAVTCASKSTQMRAQAAVARADHADEATIVGLKAAAEQFLGRYNVFVGLGLPLAVVGTIAWGFAFRRKEPGWKLLPVAPVLLYIFLFLVQV